MDSELEAIYEGILAGEMNETPANVQAALDAAIAPDTILQWMISAMRQVGKLFEAGEYFVPEMLVAARSMQSGLGVLRPHLVNTGIKPVGKVVIGTVQGDIHDIGKNLVAMMLEGAGFEVIDLGVNVSAEGFVAAVKANEPQIVAMSALLTTTMARMKETIGAMREAGILNGVKVIVGGAPVTADFAQEIGANGFAADASRAASLALSYVT
jgi:5-methyltetrahydrofolate--homocysteine methyltransferase